MKTLAVDPGFKRVGLAACDELGLTTRCLPQISFHGLQELCRNLSRLVQEEDFKLVLLGLPLNMDGTPGKAANHSQSLFHLLNKEFQKQKLNCEVLLWDERLTSFEAEQRLRAQGKSKAKSKGKLDSLAAQILLEDYLSQRKLNAVGKTQSKGESP